MNSRQRRKFMARLHNEKYEANKIRKPKPAPKLSKRQMQKAVLLMSASQAWANPILYEKPPK